MKRFFLPLLLVFLATPAMAQTAAGVNPEADPLVSLLPFVFIFAVFYFLLIRPQQKRMKAHQQMVQAVKKGDEVVTAGGLYGKITGLEGEDVALVQVASGVEVKVVKATLSQVKPKEEANKPAHQEKAAREKNDNSEPKKARIANDN